MMASMLILKKKSVNPLMVDLGRSAVEFGKPKCVTKNQLQTKSIQTIDQ